MWQCETGKRESGSAVHFLSWCSKRPLPVDTKQKAENRDLVCTCQLSTFACAYPRINLFASAVQLYWLLHSFTELESLFALDALIYPYFIKRQRRIRSGISIRKHV